MNALLWKVHYALDMLINKLTLAERTLVLLFGLVLLPVWLVILSNNNTSIIGWIVMAIHIIPTYLIASYWRYKD